jgi:hypothetical protein
VDRNPDYYLPSRCILHNPICASKTPARWVLSILSMSLKLRRPRLLVAFECCFTFVGAAGLVACTRTTVYAPEHKPSGSVSGASTSLSGPPPGFRYGLHGIEPIPKELGTAVGGAACKSSQECASGLGCSFEDPGCDTVGHCTDLGAARRSSCASAVPMCTCGVQRLTFFGSGGCAGQAFEPWELYACSCAVDLDCHAGQRCVPVGAMHRSGALRECRDARRLDAP